MNSAQFYKSFRGLIMTSVLICFVLLTLGHTVEGEIHNLQRVHPGLKFCEANPVARLMNRTRIMELERNEWHDWDMTVLQRMMKLARVFGKGNDFYVKNEFTKATSDYTDIPCDKTVPNIAEAMDYIAYPLNSLLPCPTPVKLFGANVDSGKKICEAETQLRNKNCIVYSLGSNNLFDFEESISKRFPNCKILTFDCTSQPPKVPINNLQFEKVCLGSRNEIVDGKQYHTIQHLLTKHENKAISLFKMDIEGYEMEVFDSMLTPPYSTSLPYQLLFETHWWQMSAITSLFHITLFQQLTLAGYRPVDRAVNRDCLSCNEHTFVRVYC